MSTTIPTLGADVPAPTDTAGAAGASATTSTATSGASGFGMDKDAFLRILVEQLRHQNPSQPGDSQQYIEQMTQFSMLEQLTNMSEAVQVQRADAAADTAINLVGRTVTYVVAGEQGGETVERTGQVESAEFGPDGPSLTVSGEADVQLGAITEVR